MFLITGLFDLDPLVRKIIILQASMPTAFSAIIFAKQFNRDANYVAAGTLATSIVSILTIPFFLMLVH